MLSSSIALDRSISLSDSHLLASSFVFWASVIVSGVGVSSAWASSPMPKASPRFSRFCLGSVAWWEADDSSKSTFGLMTIVRLSGSHSL